MGAQRGFNKLSLTPLLIIPSPFNLSLYLSLPLMTGLLYGSRAKEEKFHLLSLTWLLYVLLPKELESRKRKSDCVVGSGVFSSGLAKPHNTHFRDGKLF